MAKIIKLERVNIRKVFPREAGDFTPWMKEKGLEILAKSLGLKLEFVNMEVPVGVGGFKADVLARNIADETNVVIENQFGGSDHKHLGQILTYARGLNARIAIWVAESFRDEHLRVLNECNKDSDNNYQYYAVEVSLWQIGNSDFGVQFTPVVQPTRFGYWEQFINYMTCRNGPVKFGKPTRSNSVDSKSSGTFYLRAWRSQQRCEISASIHITGENRETLFNSLKEIRHDIEKEFGERLNWQERPESPDSQIILLKDDSDPEKSKWQNQHEWFAEKLELFDKIFRPRIEIIDRHEISHLKEES